MESQGIATVSISLLKDISQAVGTLRALCVPYRHGFPLGEENNPVLQEKIIKQMLQILSNGDEPSPNFVDFYE